MSGIFLRWGIPALVTVVGGTIAAVTTSGAAIPDDLATRAAPLLAEPRFDWAEVRFDMRDAIVTGRATSAAEIEDIIASLSTLHGVRSVISEVTLAEYVSPFPFAAAIADGQVTLTGGYPDDEARQTLLAAAGANAVDDLRPMSGAPDRRQWLAAANYAIATVVRFDRGEASLEDLDLTLAGRARDDASYADLTRLAQAGEAEDVELSVETIEPPLADPFVWTARFADGAITFSGVVPDAELTRQLTLGAAPIPVTSELELASGAPDDFAARAELLLQNLLLLQSGTAEISGDTASLDGDPGTVAVRDEVLSALEGSAVAIALAPPTVEDFSLVLTRRADSSTASGFVADEAMKTKIDEAGADSAAVTLANGAPDQFGAALDAALAAFGRLETGKVTITAAGIAVSGRARTSDDYLELTDAAAPRSMALTTDELLPPLAEPYRFEAIRATDGTIDLTGNAPSLTARDTLGVAASTDAEDLAIADGAPADFADKALTGIAALQLLERGTVRFDGSAWSITGATEALELPQQLAELDADGWTTDIRQPKLPMIDPYVFEARRTADGGVSFTGFLPSESLRDELVDLGGADLLNGTSLGAGAPPDFGAAARAGLAALRQLDSGSLSFADGTWTLIGAAGSDETRLALEDELAGAVDIAEWRVTVQAEGAAPVVSPYVWGARKGEDGRVTLSGYVPTEAMRKALAARAGARAQDSTLVGSGEPRGFRAAAMAGLDALSHLAEGELSFEGGAWSISGKLLSKEDSGGLNAALAGTPEIDWQRRIAPPPMPDAVEEAVAAILDEPASDDAAPAETAEAEPAADTPPEMADEAEGPVVAAEAEELTDDAVAPEAATDPAMDVAELSDDASMTEDAAPEPETVAEPEVTEPEVTEPEPAPEAVAEIDEVTEAAPEAAELETDPDPVDEPAVVGTETEATEMAAVDPAEIAAPAAAEPEAVAPAAAEPLPMGARNYLFEGSKALGQPVVFAGEVPVETMGQQLATVTGTEPSAALTVSDGLPGNFVLSADAGSRALGHLAVGEMGLDGDTWVLIGRAETEAARSAALAELSGLPEAGDWQTSVTLLPEIDTCRLHLISFATRNAILFTSGSASITPDSATALDELSGYLGECPEAAIDVEGHTDADGDADANLALSVARAEAVVDALILRGVDPARLYAVGYGESLPVASNDTAAGKRANRRIAFSVVDER